MTTAKQTKAARRNVTKAQEGGKSKKTIAHMPKKTRTELGQQGAAVARRKRNSCQEQGWMVGRQAEHWGDEPHPARSAREILDPERTGTLAAASAGCRPGKGAVSRDIRNCPVTAMSSAR